MINGLKPLNQTGLKQQLLIVFLIGVIVSMATFSIMINFLINKVIHTQMETHWQDLSHEFAEKARLALAVESREMARDFVDHFTTYPQVIYAEISLFNKEILGAHGKSQNCIFLNDENPQSTLDQYQNRNIWCFKWVIHEYDVDSTSKNTFEWRKAESPAKILGTALIIVSKNVIKQILDRIVLASLITALVILPMIYGIFHLITQNITRPLEILSTNMQLAGQGDTHVRTSISGSRDIIQMEHVFNKMMDQIELQEKNLEHQVKIRTLELVESQKAALAAANYKSMLLASVSHEMRTPLHAVTGYLQIAQEEIEQSDYDIIRLRALINKASTSGDQLIEQIQQVLDYSRIESGKMGLAIESFYPHEIINEVKDIIAPLIAKSGNQLAAKNPELRSMMSDKQKILQIILNFLTNANKFSENAVISLNSTIINNNYIVRVIDSGCGIPQSQWKQIFEPFTQLKKTASASTEGLGLGLAVAQEYAQMLGGHIRVESVIGTGSKFELSVPISFREPQ